MTIALVKTMRRSGTHRTIDNLKANLKGFWDDYRTIEHFISWSRPQHPAADLLKQLDELEAAGQHFIIKSHLLDARLATNPNDPDEVSLAKRVEETGVPIWVFRDPRDMMVSLQKYFAKFRDPKPTIDELLDEPLSIGERDHQNVLPRWCEFYAQAIHQPQAVIIRFEDWEHDFKGTLLKVAVKFGSEPVDAPEPIQLRSRGSTARDPGTGGVGGWRDALTPDQVNRIVDETRATMQALGYI